MPRFRAKDNSDELINKCTEYLNDNFHKFSKANKIKVSLEIFKRKMPTQLEHSGEIKGGNTIINIVKNYPAKDKIENRIEEAIADTGYSS